MKKKTNKFTLVCILLMFLFTNLCFNVNAEVYNDGVIKNEETNKIQDVNENCNEGNNSEQVLDNPLSQKEINEISKKNFNNSNVRASAVTQVKSSNITEGKIHPVVILIKFKGQDNSVYSSKTINDLKDALVGDKNSVNGFLKSISYNKCSIDPYFAFEQNSGIYIYEAPKGREGYDAAFTNDSWENGVELLKEAFKSVKDKIPSNINLDVNNDGEIDAIHFIVPAKTDRGDFLWPHKWEIYDETRETDVNGLKMGKYNLIPTDSIGYRPNNGSYSVMAHEFLHLLGYPDMYIHGDNNKPVGEWSVMADGKCYPTIWERIKYGGWISEKQIPIISQSGQYELSDVTKSPNTNTIAYKIPIPNSNEFFMVEYRNKEANDYDSKAPDTGIIVYRVNPNITGNSSDESEIYILRNPGFGVFGASLNGKFEHKFMNLTLKSGEYTGYTIEFISSSNGKASFKLVKNNGFSITSFEKSTQDYVSLVDNIKLKADTIGATGNVTYSFGTIINDKKTYFNKDSSNNSFYFKFSNIFNGSDLFNEAIGNHKLFVEAKDEANHKDIKYINHLVVKPLEITKLETNVQSPEIVNTPITISADFKYAASVQGIINSSKFIITKDGQSNVIGSGKKITWTPTEPGTYEITYEVTDGLNQVAKKSITFNVENKTIIYYKGYSNPKIHYQIGKGQWTSGNGVLMTSCTDVPGYYYSISIDLGKESGITACFNNGANSWDNNNRQNYKFGSGYYTFSNGVITKINKPTKKLKIDSITSELGSSYVSGNQNIFTAQVSNASGKVQYQFEYKNKTTGVSGVLRNYSEYNTLATYLGTPGQYTLTVYVKDESGSTDSKTLDFTIEEYKNLEIKSVTSSLGDAFQKGKTTQLTINTTGGKGDNYYSIEVNGKTILNASSSNSVSWTPTEAGKYEITAYAREAQGGSTSYTKTITVEDKTSNQTTIYYKGYDNAHIHYQVGNGAWTTKPEKMNSSSDVPGYYYVMTIDLGDADSLTACFNDGGNGWDSNNGNNYKFGVGYYTYSNGVITKIDKPTKQLKIDSITSQLGSSYVSGNQNIFTAQVSNASGKVQYQFEYKNKTTGVSGVLRNYSEYNKLATYLGTPGEYTLTVYVKDEAGNTDSKTLDFRIEEYKNLEIKSVTSSLGDTFQKGKATQLTINTTGGMGNNYYSIEVNGESILNASSSNTVSWTPREAGKYKITVTAKEERGGTASYTKTITVEDKTSNTVTIYYRGYNNPKIHYQIGNGQWTSDNGVLMTPCTDVSGYDYSISIDLGDASGITACFNDGANSWDNNGNKDYYFGEPGTYTVSNGNIRKIN